MSAVVLSCYFNPCGYVRLRENFEAFRAHMSAQRVYPLTIALAYDGEPHQVSATIQRWATRERSVLFQKEALLNLLLKQCVGPENDVVAWVDADVIMTNPRWLYDAQIALEIYDVVQLFGEAVNLDSQHQPAFTTESCGSRIARGDERWCDLAQSHPGYGWACRADVIRGSDLFPLAITGCGDTMMLHAFHGCVGGLFSRIEETGSMYVKLLTAWSRQLPDDLRIGYVPGTTIHMYHGNLAKRRTLDRRRWLAEVSPPMDLQFNEQGVLEWTDFALRNKKRVVDGIADYFKNRDEDA